MHDKKNGFIRLLLISALLALCFGCVTSPAIDSKLGDPYEAGDDARRNFVSNIRLALSGSDSPIRVYFEGSCSQEYKDRFREVIFPQINVTTPLKEGTDVEKIRSIFLNDETVSISQGEDSIIRVRIGEPDEEILKTEIDSLTFDIDVQYTSTLAVEAINGAPEVFAMVDKLGLEQTITFRIVRIVPPLDEYPRLPETIQDVTMDEALDLIAITFGDIVMYGACSNRYNVYRYYRGE